MTQMQRWEPVAGVHYSNVRESYMLNGEEIDIGAGKYEICQLVDAAEVGVLVTYDQLISMQMAMLVAWEGVKGTVQSDQTVARLQQLDNQIGAWLTQMKGE